MGPSGWVHALINNYFFFFFLLPKNKIKIKIALDFTKLLVFIEFSKKSCRFNYIFTP